VLSTDFGGVVDGSRGATSQRPKDKKKKDGEEKCESLDEMRNTEEVSTYTFCPRQDGKKSGGWGGYAGPGFGVSNRWCGDGVERCRIKQLWRVEH